MKHYIIDEEKAIGLIPARGGSKSIPLKNIVTLGGLPMITYVIRAGKNAVSLDTVYCSTDHEKIASVCRNEGVTVLERPSHLGRDETPVTAVILHVLETLHETTGVMPGMVALLQPTSPFILSKHIDDCVTLLSDTKDADSAQTVAPVFHNAHAFNQRVIKDGRVSFRFREERAAAYNKQLKPKHYTFGNLVVTRSRSLLNGSDCFGGISVPVEIPRAYALDVDTLEDLDYASYLVKEGKIVLQNMGTGNE
jgi:CMP-N-acetylneuraminic acid synthetase